MNIANPPRRRPGVGFIMVSVCLDFLSMSVVLPVLPPLVQRFAHGDVSAAGRYIGLMTAAWGLAQFFAAPVLGALSDRFGRRPVLLISLFGLGCDYVLMAFAPSLVWLFVGRLISGLTAAGFAVASAYIADVTPPEQRAGRYGLIGAAFGIGFIVGPAIGGLLGQVHIRLPFLGAAGLTLLAALYGAFVLPESLAPENRSAFAWKKANPVGALRFLASHRELLGLSSVFALMQFAHNVLPTLFILYVSNRYGWSLKATGASMALVGVCNILVQGLLVKRVVPVLGDWGALIGGLLFGAAGFAIFGLSPSGPGFMAGILVFSLIGLFQPGYQALATRRVAPSEQGRFQGANAGIQGLTGILGPLTFGFVYAWFTSADHPQLPGSGFLLAAILQMLALLIALAVMRGAAGREAQTAA
jgi:DHA1 family tetracycline resistance protein-like MFS transporter